MIITRLKNRLKYGSNQLLFFSLGMLSLMMSWSTYAQDPNFHIYLCFGQSNMEGNGVIEAQDKTGVDSRFQVMGAVNCSQNGKSYTLGKLQTATPPVFRCNTGLGPIDNFGRTMVANLPSNIKVGVVPVAIGGCDIALFEKQNYAAYVATAPSWMIGNINSYGGNPYARLVEVAKMAQKEGVIKGILLHQGETNNNQSNWPQRVKGIYDNLIKDLGLDASKTPLLVGELVRTEQGGSCGAHNKYIATVPSVIPNSNVISAEGLPHKGDGLHFTPAAYRTLGQRYAQKMLTLLPPSCTTRAPSVAFSKIMYEVGDTPKQLSAMGSSLKWYSVATGGTAQTVAPTPSTATVGISNYYVSQTAGGCESPRTAISVTVSSTYKISKTNTPIVIDGEIEDNWKNSSAVDAVLGKAIVGTVSSGSDLSANVKVLWDNTSLYVLASVTDQTLNNDSPNSYDDDAFEVYVDVNNDKATTYGANDAQFTFGWNDGTTVGVLPSGRSIAGITYKVLTTANGYVIEAQISWATVQGVPSSNQLVGLEFMINDDDNGMTRDKKLAWTSSTDDAYQNPSLFGTAKLVDAAIATGLSDDQAEDLLEVLYYPNPFGAYVNVITKGDFGYQLFNLSGELVESGNSNGEVKLGHDLVKGLYFLKIIKGDKSRVLKLIKEERD